MECTNSFRYRSSRHDLPLPLTPTGIPRHLFAVAALFFSISALIEGGLVVFVERTTLRANDP